MFFVPLQNLKLSRICCYICVSWVHLPVGSFTESRSSAIISNVMSSQTY